MNMTNFKLKKSEFIQIVLLYLLLQTHGGTLWRIVLGNFRIKAVAVLALTVFVALKYGIRIPNYLILYIGINLTLFFISANVTDGSIGAASDLGAVFAMNIYVLLAYVILKIHKAGAVRKYIAMVVFFATISLFFFGLQLLFGNGIFPELLFKPVGGGNLCGFLLYTVNKGRNRNNGFFYEPGVYVTVLNVALYFLLYYGENIEMNKKQRNRDIFILFLAILSTGSTAGYMVTAVLVCGTILAGKRKRRQKTMMLLFLIAAVFSLDFLWNKQNSLVYKYVIFKFADIGWNRTTGYYQYGSSGGARIYMWMKAMEALRISPWWGIGSTGYFAQLSEGVWQNEGTGNILAISLVRRGLLTTASVIAPLLYSCYKHKKKLIHFLVFGFMYGVTIFSQAELIYASFALLVFFIQETSETEYSAQGRYRSNECIMDL